MPKLFTKSAFNHAVKCPMRAYYYRNLEGTATLKKLGAIKWVSETGFAGNVIEDVLCYAKAFLWE